MTTRRGHRLHVEVIAAPQGDDFASRRGGDRPDGPGAASVARRDGRRRRTRLGQALLASDGFRGPTPPSSPPAKPMSLDAGAHHRRLQRRPATRTAHDAADREQHIRRERPTPTSAPRRCCWPTWPACSVYHGPRLRLTHRRRIHRLTAVLAAGLERGQACGSTVLLRHPPDLGARQAIYHRRRNAGASTCACDRQRHLRLDR